LKQSTLPLLAWISVFIAAGGVFLFSKTVTVLSVRNLHDRGSVYFKVAPSQQVTLFFINSIYHAPVEEVFEVRQRDLILKAVWSSSPAVMEYYGFEGSGPVQTMDRSLGPAIWIKTSMRQPQSLRMGGRTLDLHAVGNPGDRIELRVEEVSLASFLLSRGICRLEKDAATKIP
jgi:hypothetical protein